MIFNTCNISVLFPTPGSPPIKIKEPGTRPPPRTLETSCPNSPGLNINNSYNAAQKNKQNVKKNQTYPKNWVFFIER